MKKAIVLIGLILFVAWSAGATTIKNAPDGARTGAQLNTGAADLSFPLDDGTHDYYITWSAVLDAITANYQGVDATLTALAGLTITQGSLIYGTGSDAFSVLAKGTAGQILWMNSGATAPEWTSTLTGLSFDLGTATNAQQAVVMDADGILTTSLTALLPAGNDTAALGSATVSWSDLFLASGGVINFNNGDVTITHSSNKLTVAGGDVELTGSLVTGSGSKIELGHATDTTIERVSAGIIKVEGLSIPRIVAKGTLSAHDEGSLASGACSSAIDGGTATGVATTDVISWNFNGDPTGITGFAASANGGLFIYAYPTSDHVNFKICNNTAGAINAGAITLNWMVLR